MFSSSDSIRTHFHAFRSRRQILSPSVPDIHYLPLAMSRPIRHRTPKRRVATSTAENLATPTRRRRSSSGRKRGERPRRMSAAERAEEARINAALRRHAWEEYNWEISPHGPWGPAFTIYLPLACLFVKDNSGRWVGGKFDWISSSRRSRNFENIFNGYSQWSLANVPNPCQAAFVIASADGKRRSNVLVGTWSR